MSNNYNRYMNLVNVQRYYVHRLNEYGIWEVRGEDPNADMGGQHSNPFIALKEGRLEDVIRWAVEQPSFWEWGAGGEFIKREIEAIPEKKRDTVWCDDNCGAFADPQTFEEYKLAYEHWRSHSSLNGCSHQR